MAHLTVGWRGEGSVAWSSASTPVWLEQRELVIECWLSNVSLYSRDRAVLLALGGWTAQELPFRKRELGSLGGERPEAG